MTEQDWLESTDPKPMLEFITRKVIDRKVQLFSVACFEKLWPLLTDVRSRRAVEAVSMYAEGRLTEEELVQARNEAFMVLHEINFGEESRWRLCDMAANITIVRGLSNAAGLLLEDFRYYPDCPSSDILRDIIGNPYRPITLDPAWLTPTVLALAQATYENRNLSAGTLDNARLAIFADALEDAGCDNADILNHCRQPGAVHVRGCFVLDLLLGKS
jgi:hypothetical protein